MKTTKTTKTPRQTPHSGYHWNGRQQPFFEGWYYRLTLPPTETSGPESIAFMYSIQDPACRKLGSKTAAWGGAAQILGPRERYFCRSLPDLSRFWASSQRLEHGQRRGGGAPIAESYRATATQHEGQLWDGRSQQAIRWQYTLEPVYGWGSSHQPQQSTAGALSQFQIFEPGWQVLMAHGWATGWFEWGNERQEFEQVPAYAEKNWGGAFPQQWFWIQCNAFENEPDLSVTSGGGLRQVLGLQESVGMVGVHYQGRFYEFVPWNGRVRWQVSPWGSWQVWAENREFSVELRGATDEAGVRVRVPTAQGLEWRCRDTTRGELRLKLWRKVGRKVGQRRVLLVGDRTHQAGLEVGGKPWTQDYKDG